MTIKYVNKQGELITRLTPIVAMTVAYFIAGKLGYLLTIFLGYYASPVWPPAGIALAGILIYGTRVWPGILLGAFLINGLNPIAPTFASGNLNSLLSILFISSCATLQALTGAYCVKRYAGFPNALTREKEILWFLFYGGVLSTLLNSTLSISMLVATGQLPIENALNNWLTWWSGDVSGAIIFTPIALVWLQQNTDDWHNRRLVISLPILAMLIITTTAIIYESRSSDARIELEFDQQTKDINHSLQTGLDNDIHILGALKSFFLHASIISSEEFTLYTKNLLKDYQDIQSMSWDPLIQDSARESFEKSIQKQGFPNFQIYELDANRQPLRAKDRTSYVPITYTEPYQGNEKALGFDISSEPMRLEALKIATDTGELTITPRIKLVQDKSQYSVLAVTPLYAKDRPHLTLEEKRSTILGYVVGIIRTENMVTSALKNKNTQGISYRLIDSSAPPAMQLLFSNDESFPSPLVIQKETWFSTEKTLSSRLNLPFGNRVWQFEAVPNQNYFINHQSNFTSLILVAGLVLTNLITMITVLLSGRSQRLQQLVSQRTQELEQQHNLTYAALKEKEQFHERLNLILNATGEGIYGIGIDGNCTFINISALTILGFTLQEVLGKNSHQLIHYSHEDGSPYDIEKCPIYRALHGETIATIDNEVFWRKDGTSFSVQYQSHPIKKDEEIIGCVVSFMDITERKQNEALLWAAKEKAEKLAKTKSQFLANMSHEIRTPMNAIIGFSDLALFDEIPTETRAYLQDINTASNNLMDILNDILDLSKLEAGRMSIISTPFHLNDLLTSIYNLFLRIAQTKGLVLTLNIADNIPNNLVGDSIRLRQVLVNLLGNAIKFTKQGVVRLSVTLKKLDETKARLLFSIIDTGIGISAEQQDQLFQPFSQVDDGFSRHAEGTGLGLVISQELLHLMGSHITLISTLELGSRFNFELTLLLEPSSRVDTPQLTIETLGSGLNDIKILVVEDNTFNQKIIKEILTRYGVSVVLADNGLEALEALAETSFDIVLMDLHMPDMNGYEATIELRKNPRHVQLPVIAFSASVTDEDRKRCIDAGMNDFAGKPINTKELLTTLERWIVV